MDKADLGKDSTVSMEQAKVLVVLILKDVCRFHFGGVILPELQNENAVMILVWSCRLVMTMK